MSKHPSVEIIRSPRISYRWAGELLVNIAIHRISLRYRETLLGFGWILLQPIALTVIFNYIRKVANIETGDVPYPLFAATGIVAWTFTSLVISQTLQSLTGAATILKRVALPKFVLPLTVIVSNLADLCITGLLLVALFVYYQFIPPSSIFLIFIPFLVHIMLLVGLGYIVALTNIFLRDIGHGIPSLLQLWFFASPVFYPTTMVPSEFEWLAQWNPMTGIIEGYRATILYGQLPSMELIIPATIVSALIFSIGVGCFIRLEGIIADML